MIKTNLCVFLDAGHGGMYPNGKYATDERDGKKFNHIQGVFHNEGWFYEGVSNRIIADLIAINLMNKGVNVVKTYHPVVDTPRDARCQIANLYNKTIQSGIFISIHSNASNGKASGIEVWTTVGQTASDAIATKLHKDLSSKLEGVIMRSQTSNDGDPDYEKDFDVLINTDMPAVLIENLFFDNFKDASKLIDESYQNQFAEIISNSIFDILKNK